MPISSGALGWPKSYWSPPPVDTRINQNRVYPVSEWAQKIINDKERKKRRKATRVIAQKAKKQKERQRRRRKCLLIFLVILLVLLLAAAGFLVWFFVFNKDKADDIQTIPPLSCKGHWRTEFLGFKNSNGTYTCCYDIVQAVKTRVLANGDRWPDGYVINKTDCKDPTKQCADVYTSHPEKCSDNGCSSVIVSDYFSYVTIFFTYMLFSSLRY